MSAFCPQCGLVLPIWGLRHCSQCGWSDKPIKRLLRAASAVLAEADRRANAAHPFAYMAPWGELTRLREAMREVNTKGNK